MRIGIDVGGTHTDAALMEHASVLQTYKTPTTPAVTHGITTALRMMLGQAHLAAGDIDAVMIGTTHYLNAVVERQRLMPVGVIRIGLPSTSSVPPMSGWPADLRAVVGNHVHLAHGGYQFDGRPIAPLDPQEIRAIARDLLRAGVRCIAISSVFSLVNAEMELRVAELVREVIPDAAMTLSHEIGQVGLLERENAAILNACLRDLAHDTVAAFRHALHALSIHAPLYLSQNDGTLMSADYAERYPVLTFACGATNSMRGAAFLSGLNDAIVVDIGGTTTDVGVLTRGFPTDVTVATEIGGIRNNLRMPDVYSIGLGGGSIVSEGSDGPCIGPHSVGHALMHRSLVFGGDTLTATDIAVAAGLGDLGDRARVAHLDKRFVERCVRTIQRKLISAVDHMRMTPDPLPAVIVGGGSILVHDRLPGVSEIVVPEHYEVANAIGAAIAQMGGESDHIFSLAHMTRDDAMDQARQEAVQKAVSAGADPATIRVTEVDEVPLSYMPHSTTRIRVKAVGDVPRAW